MRIGSTFSSQRLGRLPGREDALIRCHFLLMPQQPERLTRHELKTRIRSPLWRAKISANKTLRSERSSTAPTTDMSPVQTFEVVRRRKWTLLRLSMASAAQPTGASSTEESASQTARLSGRMDNMQNAIRAPSYLLTSVCRRPADCLLVRVQTRSSRGAFCRPAHTPSVGPMMPPSELADAEQPDDAFARLRWSKMNVLPSRLFSHAFHANATRQISNGDTACT